MKYVVVEKFMDGSKSRRKGEVVAYSNDRAKKLLGLRVIEPYIEEAMLEEKTEKAVKRTRKKKVEEPETDE